MTETNAAELKTSLETATEDEARLVLAEERSKEKPRTTVIEAAEARLAKLAIPGEPTTSTPTGVWARLLDVDGKPAKVDGAEVRAELTPATKKP